MFKKNEMVTFVVFFCVSREKLELKIFLKGDVVYVFYRLEGSYWKNIFPRSQKQPRPKAEGLF